jgi:hypothetical protein
MIATAPPMKEPAVRAAELARRQAELVARVEKTRRDHRRFSRAWAGVWIVLGLLIVGGLLALADYYWVLSQSIRQANWAMVGVIGVALAIRQIVVERRAAFNRLDTAAEIESAFPDLGQRVCTTLEYAEPTPSTMPAWPSLVRALATDTEQRTVSLDFTQVIPWRRLRWPAAAAICLAAFFVLAIIIWPSARTAAMRLFLLPVHYTQLQVEPGDLSVKFDHDATIRAIISGRAVKKAELLTRKAGSDNPWTAVSLGPDDPKETDLLGGTLETSIKKCHDDLEYMVTADAVESETYRLTVMHPLLLKQTEASIVPPAYTRQKTTTVKAGDFQVIEGSAVHFRFELDRPAQSGWLRLIPRGKAAAEAVPPVALGMQGKAMVCTVTNVTKDIDYEIQAEAADGMKLDPRRFHISVQPDAKPTVHIVKPTSVIEVLPTTEVTVQVDAKDDFGLTKVGIVYRIGDGPKETLRLDEDPKQPVSLTSLAILYLEEHELNYQDAIVYYAFVEDNYPSGPHRVTSELQFIDIRAFKREFFESKPGKSKKSVTLELLIGRQRTNLQHTFTQLDQPKANARMAKRLAKAERSLAKLTKDFADELAERVGRVPCLEEAIAAMEAGATELGQKHMTPACRKQEIALGQLIQARKDLEWLLANPKSSGETEKIDYQAQRNMPEPPKDKDEDEEKAENLQQEIEELAKTERDTADELEGKSGSNSSTPKPPKDASGKKSQKGEPSQGGGQSQGEPSQSEKPSQGSGDSPKAELSQGGDKGEQPPKGDASKGGDQSQDKSDTLAERQQRAAQKAADIAKKMEEDDAITDLANERMANAEREIQSSAKSLERGDKKGAGREARNAAAQLDRLAQHVGALKATELAAKLQTAENMARQLAKQQRDAESSESSGESGESGKGEKGSESSGKSGKSGKGEETADSSESSGEEGEGGEGDGQGNNRASSRQRARAENARTVEDLLKESQKDATLSDPGLVRALEDAARENSPKEIADQMDRAANALSSGQREQAKSEIGKSAKRLESLAGQLESARRIFTQPKLDALLEAEKQAAELQKELKTPVAEERRGEIEKKLGDLRRALGPLRGLDENLRKEATALGDAIEGGLSSPGVWVESARRGYYLLPRFYGSSVERVDHALQVQIQAMILKEAILDEDQPVPEQYRKLVEEYYRILSEDLR